MNYYAWLSPEENSEKMREENPEVFKKLDKALKNLKK